MESSLQDTDDLSILNYMVRKFFFSLRGRSKPSQPDEFNRKIKDITLSEKDVRLLNYPKYEFNLRYQWLGEKYSYIYSFYRHMLPNKAKAGLDNIMRMFDGEYTEKDILTDLKDFGTNLLEKIINEDFPLYLYYYIELHYLAGYDTYHHRSYDMMKDTMPFLEKRRLDPAYVEIFKKNIRETIDKISFKNCANMRFDDYVKYRDNWAIMGSCNIGSKIHISTENFDKESVINSKFTNTLVYTDEQLLKLLHEYRPHQIRPFLKENESAKARIVIGYDTISYIRCCFLEEMISDFNGFGMWTTVGFSPDKLYQVRQEFDCTFNDPSKICVCTDQSAFDQHQYKELFIYAFDYLCSRLEKVNPDVAEIRELELYGLRNAYFDLGNGVHKAWENGLCSGHKFTSLLGSILNRSSTMTVADITDTRRFIQYAVFQGDDATMVCDSSIDVDNFLQGYSRLDMVVNPMKTWRGKHRTEYLHQLYVKGSVYALPARSCLSVIFKDPQAAREIPDSKFNSDISVLRTLSRRGLIVDRLLVHCTSNFFNKYMVKYDRKMVHCFIHTPQCIGGGGFLPYVRKENYTQMVIDKRQHREFKTTITSHVGYVNKTFDVGKYILKHVYDHLPAPNVDTSVTLTHVNLEEVAFSKSMPLIIIPSAYNPDKSDNTKEWTQHCREMIGEVAPYKGISYTKYAKLRKIKETFSLTDSFSDWLVDPMIKSEFKTLIDSARRYYLSSRSSVLKVVSSVLAMKDRLRVKNFAIHSALTDYGLFY